MMKCGWAEVFRLCPAVTNAILITQTIVRRRKMSEKVYGIDLGTTYSCLAGFDEFGKVTVFENDQMETTTPSVVWFEGRNATVGSVAKEQAGNNPDVVVSAVKRRMGTDEEVLQSGKKLRPEMVSALILKKLVKDAAVAGEHVHRVVITCPAYFGVAEREATKRAGELAGLEVLSIINEPSAAAFSYGIEKGSLEGKAALVFDLGGGTFDATVIRIGKEIDVVATGGDSHLGGQDWDETIGRYFIERFCEETGYDRGRADEDAAFLAFAKTLAEKHKRMLTGATKVKVALERYGKRCTFDFTRDDFDQKTVGLLQNAILATKQVLDEAEQKDPSFSRSRMEVLMVGGSTFMPQVAEALTREFGVVPKSYRPNESVARGAVLYARQMAISKRIEERGGNPDDLFLGGDSSNSDMADLFIGGDVERDLFLGGAKDGGFRVMHNVTSKSFGVWYVSSIEDKVGFVSNVISKNEKLPFRPGNGRGESVSHTLVDNQTGVRFKIYENDDISVGSRIDVDFCRYIGEMSLTGLPPGRPAGQECIVYMELDKEGLLHAWGIDSETKKRCDATFRTEGVISQEEVADAKAVVDWFRVQ